MDQLVPHTAESLGTDLRALGLRAGDVVLLHSSVRSLGFVVGGAQAFVQALLGVLGPGGTLVVPAHTSDNCDPAGWRNPPVPEAWWPVIRDQAPGFDPARTPSRWMGVIAELVRTWPGALRSDHPRLSFAAVGAHAAGVTGVHRVDDALGEDSPLGAVYRLDGKVLLLGCGHDSNTSLHLAEWRQESPPRGVNGASIRRPDGTGKWTTWVDVIEDEEDFERLGADFEAAVGLPAGRVGEAPTRLMSQRALVDFATAWLAANRPKA
ncbi:aminoglycoside N(3)-acetyltransferase [Sphaerisporangium corydalis]|uniref:Aminoglycoside N(3)-acetyltransferase n=1 Tax=Sphaerisporangium corydalis TaxID=1441875 RepID=A0ABV9EEK4_9ACTN|nr:AAC(3) family N-acetyltransferase [Sphaerisporangium corydalis]